MQAREIQVGDEFIYGGNVSYVVEEVEHVGDVVRARVRFADGGGAWREWDEVVEVPLRRPEGHS